MTTLVTPIITQMELDRDRLKQMVNGAVDETVVLEGRTEKTIAGQVKYHVDNLAIDLNNAIAATEAARDTTYNYQQSANQAAQDAQAASDAIGDVLTDATAIRDETAEIKTATETLKDDTQQLKTDTGIIRDETADIRDSTEETFQRVQEMMQNTESSYKKAKALYPIEGDTVPLENIQLIANSFDPYNHAISGGYRTLELAEVTAPDTYSVLETINGEDLHAYSPTVTLDTTKTYAWRIADEVFELEGAITSTPDFSNWRGTEWTEFSVATGLAYIERPTVSKADASDNSLTPTINCSAFNSINGTIEPKTTIWTVRKTNGEIVWQHESNGVATSVQIPADVLAPNVNYTVKAMHVGYVLNASNESVAYTSTWSDSIAYSTYTMDYKAEIEALQSGKENVVKTNLNATSAPTVNDDSTQGYEPRSIWFDTVAGESYRCLNATAGAALWVQTSLTLDELGSAAAANTEDFDAAGTASSAINTHEAAADPHPQYLTQNEGDSRYALADSGVSGDFSEMPTVNGVAIVESGSNSNGHWVRFADGTQIARHRVAIDAAGSGNTTRTWTYPMAFVSGDIPSVHGDWAGSSTATLSVKMQSPNVTSATTLVNNAQASSISGYVSVTAFGRWKV